MPIKPLLSFGVLCFFASNAAYSAPADIGPTATLFEGTFIRSHGQPQTVTNHFALPPDVGVPYTLTVANGDATGVNRVSSASITLNNIEILGSSDFNDTVASISRSVSIASSDTLTVQLRSAPGSYLKLSITGIVFWPVITVPAVGVLVNVPPQWFPLPNSTPTEVNYSNVPVLSERPLTQLLNESLFHIDIAKNANPTKLPISLWVDKFLVTANVPLARSSVTLQGRPAVRLETGEIGRWARYFVASDPDVIEISFGLYNPKFIPTYETMLNSITFDK